MAGILKSSGTRISNCSITFLIAAPGEVCHIISETLHKCAKLRNYLITVHQCESVADLVQSKINISIDFIIFACTWRSLHSLTEVEKNIFSVDEHYMISGSACLVNCSNISHSIGSIASKTFQICDKYNLHFLSADISDPDECNCLGNRILNRAETRLGLKSGIPMYCFP